MWRHRERRGFAAALEQHEALYLRATGRGEIQTDDAAPNREWVSEVLAGSKARVVQKFRFSKVRHINIGEMRARRALLRRFARQRQCAGTRRLVAYDSRVTIGVAAKGRSPSKALNHEQRRTMPYLVGPDIQEGGLWVDSKRNPADHPSRNRPIPESAPPSAWVSRFLAGDISALEQRLGLLPQHDLAHDWKKGARIGEADHPGPGETDLATWAQAGRTRRAASRPPIVLRVEAEGEAPTRERRSRFLGRFLDWLHANGRPTNLEDIAAPVADGLLEEYGQHLYDSGAGSNELAETINAVKKAHRHLEGFRQLKSAWDTLTAWQNLEPGESSYGEKHHVM